MKFSILSKLRDNKLWWVDVVFYFVISSLIATIACYLIFTVKIYFQKENIKVFEEKLNNVGTDDQKEMEKQVLDYQKKLNDYYPLVQGHRIFSNILAYFEQNTLPNVWFSSFGMSGKDANIALTGETENLETFSKQISVFEASGYLTKITVLGSRLGDKNKADFNVVLSLEPKIFVFKKKPAAETVPENIPENVESQ